MDIILHDIFLDESMQLAPLILISVVKLGQQAATN
jgi:hypothetical protein